MSGKNRFLEDVKKMHLFVGGTGKGGGTGGRGAGRRGSHRGGAAAPPSTPPPSNLKNIACSLSHPINSPHPMSARFYSENPFILLTSLSGKLTVRCIRLETLKGT